MSIRDDQHIIDGLVRKALEGFEPKMKPSDWDAMGDMLDTGGFDHEIRKEMDNLEPAMLPSDWSDMGSMLDNAFDESIRKELSNLEPEMVTGDWASMEESLNGVQTSAFSRYKKYLSLAALLLLFLGVGWALHNSGILEEEAQIQPLVEGSLDQDQKLITNVDVASDSSQSIGSDIATELVEESTSNNSAQSSEVNEEAAQAANKEESAIVTSSSSEDRGEEVDVQNESAVAQSTNLNHNASTPTATIGQEELIDDGKNSDGEMAVQNDVEQNVLIDDKQKSDGSSMIALEMNSDIQEEAAASGQTVNESSEPVSGLSGSFTGLNSENAGGIANAIEKVTSKDALIEYGKLEDPVLGNKKPSTLIIKPVVPVSGWTIALRAGGAQNSVRDRTAYSILSNSESLDPATGQLFGESDNKSASHFWNSKVGFSFGIGVQKSLSKRMSLDFGVDYAERSFHSVDIIDPEYIYGQTSHIQKDFSQIELPIGLKYDFLSKRSWSAYIGAQWVPAVVLKENYQFGVTPYLFNNSFTDSEAALPEDFSNYSVELPREIPTSNSADPIQDSEVGVNMGEVQAQSMTEYALPQYHINRFDFSNVRVKLGIAAAISRRSSIGLSTEYQTSLKADEFDLRIDPYEVQNFKRKHSLGLQLSWFYKI